MATSIILNIILLSFSFICLKGSRPRVELTKPSQPSSVRGLSNLNTEPNQTLKIESIPKTNTVQPAQFSKLAPTPIDPDTVTDQKLLREMFVEVYSSAKNKPVNGPQLLKIASRMQDLNREDLEPAVYLLDAITYLKTDSDESKIVEETWNRAESALKIASRLKPNDPQVEEYGIWVKSQGLQSNLLSNVANEHIKNYPKSALGYYYLAGLYWNANRDLAFQYLQTAQNREPREPRIRETLRQIEAGEPEPAFDFYTFSRPSLD